MENQSQTENQKRSGNTVVSSVSLSKEFKKFMDDHNISPTWAMRKGVAIEMFERGMPDYNSETNKNRYNALKEIEKEAYMQDLPEKLLILERQLREIRAILEIVK